MFVVFYKTENKYVFQSTPLYIYIHLYKYYGGTLVLLQLDAREYNSHKDFILYSKS